MKWIKYFLFLCLISHIDSALASPHDSKYFIKILKKGGFGSALTKGTTLKPVYRKGDYIILYYDNLPGTGHENFGLVVLKNMKYHHDYNMNDPYQCRPVTENFECKFSIDGYDRKFEHYKIKISDILEGKQILLAGSFEDAWRGSKNLTTNVQY